MNEEEKEKNEFHDLTSVSSLFPPGDLSPLPSSSSHSMRVGVKGEGQAGGTPPPPPSSSPCCGPRDGIQLPDNLAQDRDPLTPQPSCYQLPLTHTQSDAIILLQRVYWHRGFKAWACGPIPFSLCSQGLMTARPINKRL